MVQGNRDTPSERLLNLASTLSDKHMRQPRHLLGKAVSILELTHTSSFG